MTQIAGFVTYYEHERAWGLGPRVFEIGSAYPRRQALCQLARPHLTELVRETGGTAHLAILHGTEVLYLAREDPHDSNLALITEEGIRLPAHLTAVGLSILAQLPEAQVRAIFSGQPLVSRTGRGPATLDDLYERLEAVRGVGHAFEEGLTSVGIGCVAAAVFSHERIPIAAIGLSFSPGSTAGVDLEGLEQGVREATTRMTRTLHGCPPGHGRVEPGASRSRDRTTGSSAQGSLGELVSDVAMARTNTVGSAPARANAAA